MPVTDLDTLIAKLKDPGVDVHELDSRVLAAGLEDLRNRMSHAEYSHLKALSQARINADRLTTVEGNVAALTTDGVEFRRSVNDATKLPHEHAEKLVELEGRVRACEGAVGAAPYKVPKPIEPVSAAADKAAADKAAADKAAADKAAADKAAADKAAADKAAVDKPFYPKTETPPAPPASQKPSTPM
jgi:hypothetical protein